MAAKTETGAFVTQHPVRVCASVECCTVAYLELRRISAIRHYLSVDVTKTLICAVVLSRIDCCNRLLAGIPEYLLNGLENK